MWVRILLAVAFSACGNSASAEPTKVSLADGQVTVTIPDKWVQVPAPGLSELQIKSRSDRSFPECNVRSKPIDYLPRPGQQIANELTEMRTADAVVPAAFKVLSFSISKLVDGVRILEVSYSNGAGRITSQQFMVARGKDHMLVYVDCIGSPAAQEMPQDKFEVEAFLSSIRITQK